MRWRIGLPGACEHWWPEWPTRGLSGNETARALISMMARSTTRSNQRPDTLMQDRIAARSTKTSCNARPDHTSGQERRYWPRPPTVRCSADSGHNAAPPRTGAWGQKLSSVSRRHLKRKTVYIWCRATGGVNVAEVRTN
jgi:hypothetical protein